MNKYLNKITCIDCLKGMKGLPDNCIDTIITDPPYGLKFMNKKWDYSIPSVEYFKEMLRVSKPGATLLCFGGTKTFHRIAVNIEDAGWELIDTLIWVYATGFTKAQDISKMMMKNKISEDKIKQWVGYKTHALKPAYEPIIMARKRNEGSYVDNALKWGIAGLNIDGARIEFENTKNPATNPKYRLEMGYKLPKKGQESKGVTNFKSSKNDININGRFPANLILGGDAGKYIDEQSGNVGNGHWAKTKVVGYGEFGGGKSEYKGVGRKDKTKGGVSRYFKNIPLDSRMIYIPKASRKERDKGLENKELKAKNEYDKIGGSKYGIGSGNEKNTLYHNNHPTVKPLKLMEYLCTLTRTPTGGVVLDPYIGSGTTAMACRLTGRDFIGFELNQEYVNIANARLKAIPNKLKRWV